MIDLTDKQMMDKFRMLSAVLELSLRVGSGGRMTRANMIQFCQHEYNTKSKREKALLAEMLGVWEQTYGERFEMEKAYKNAGLPSTESES
jgi:hypothetical protein